VGERRGDKGQGERAAGEQLEGIKPSFRVLSGINSRLEPTDTIIGSGLSSEYFSKHPHPIWRMKIRPRMMSIEFSRQ
jgi:hypothetical protein